MQRILVTAVGVVVLCLLSICYVGAVQARWQEQTPATIEQLSKDLKTADEEIVDLLQQLRLARAQPNAHGQAPPTPTHTAAPLTELEALRVENVRLEGIILQRQINDWEEKRKKLRADIESIRQGWLWNPENGAFNPKDTAKQNH